MSLVNQSQFAKHIGKSKQYVSKLIKENKIALNEDGLIFIEEALHSLKKASDPARVKNPILKEVNIEELETLPINTIKAELNDPTDYNKAKAHNEYYHAKLSEIKLLKEQGALTESALVERQYFLVSRQLRDKIFNIKYRISGQLSIMDNETEISNLLDREFRIVFEEIVKNMDSILEDDDKDEI